MKKKDTEKKKKEKKRKLSNLFIEISK